MSKTRTLFVLGVLIAMMPYSGFPYLWKNGIFTALGLGLALFAYKLHRDERRGEATKVFDNFSENSDFQEKV